MTTLNAVYVSASPIELLLAAFPIIIGAVLVVLFVGGLIWVGVKIISLALSMLFDDLRKPVNPEEQ